MISHTTCLKNYGFKKIGRWVKSHYKSTKHLSHLPGIAFEIPKSHMHERNVVYSFISNGNIIYIGETTAGMASRFAGYRYGNPAPSDTDNRVKIYITDVLSSQQGVDIWFAQPIAQYNLPNGNSIDVPASKPLEELMIGEFSPVLNVKNLNN